MRVEDARVGRRVKVTERHKAPELRGMIGRIVHRHGYFEHAALEVSFNGMDRGGDSLLFWNHELEDIEEYPALKPWSLSIFGRDR